MSRSIIVQQSLGALELELLFQIHVHQRPGGQIGFHHRQQPAIAGVALHAQAQQASAAAGEVAELVLQLGELGQDFLGLLVEPFPGPGQAQAAPLFLPETDTQRRPSRPMLWLRADWDK